MIALLLSLLLACGGDPMIWVPGSTLRVSEPDVAEGTELDLHIFTEEADCVGGGVDDEELPLCLPHVDRASGEVRVGFQFRLDDEAFPLPLTKEHVEVFHQGSRVLDGDGGMQVEVIPHGPNRANQLFILVIDGSGSMNLSDSRGISRIQKVRRALLKDEVAERFYPGQGVKTGVVLLTFTEGDPRPVGTSAVEIIQNKGRYKKLVREHLNASGGYTWFYNAVRYASGELLRTKEIRNWLDLHQAQPTIVALTDGYNNQSASDTCGSNAERLSTLLKSTKEARTGDEVDIRTRPTFFTIGLGRPFRRTKTIVGQIDKRKGEVTPKSLCGRYANTRIDGVLETTGIDNASLLWISRLGGGASYVRQDAKGLGEAFQGAAATRYDWFELRYKVDPAYLRRSFESRVRLISFAEAESGITLYPSAWLDPPTGVPGEDGWAEDRPYRSTAAVVMPVMGLLVALSFLGAALFNTRRVLFGRVSARKRKR